MVYTINLLRAIAFEVSTRPRNLPPPPCQRAPLPSYIRRASQTRTASWPANQFPLLDRRTCQQRGLHLQLTKLSTRPSGPHLAYPSRPSLFQSAAGRPLPALPSPSSAFPHPRDPRSVTSTSGTCTIPASVSGLLAPNSCIPPTSLWEIDCGPVFRTCGPW
jgi:hypothetical protein